MDLSTLLALIVPAKYLIYVTAVFGVAGVITANVPAPTSGPLASAWKVLNVLAQNYGKAKNAEPAP